MQAIRDSSGVVLIVRIGGPSDGPPVDPGFRGLARAAHPGLVSLAATIGTGCWPEQHGVVGRQEPHPDRLSPSWPCPERRTSVVWRDVVAAGGRVVVVGWPHATRPIEAEDEDALVWFGSSVTAPSGVAIDRVPLGPGSVLPRSRRADLRRRSREEARDLTLDLLAEGAEEGPDLLMGFVLDDDVAETDRRVDDIVDRHRRARRREPVIIEVRHPWVPDSILLAPRFGPRPWIRVRNGEGHRGPVRPRVDDLARLVRDLLGASRSESPASPGRESGFTGTALDEAGLGGALRMSTFELKSHARQMHSEIGLSLLARGDRTAAATWIRGACEDQHGRLDPRLAVILMTLLPEGRRADFLAEVRGRLGSFAERCDRWLVDAHVDPADWKGVGTFIFGQLAFEVRRRARTKQ